jgi:ankyrin repeat protein
MFVGSIETLAELLGSTENKSTYFNLQNRFSGDRPVHTAMRHGFLATFKALVANGADPTAKNRFGDSVTDFLGDFEPEEVQSIVDQYKWDSADGKG